MANRESINEEWVMSRRNLNHGLSPLQSILKSIGNPQNTYRCIHVAGTNGKGSTCNYLKDILVSQGYKVGMFTSPHLMTHRDRIRINDSYISEDAFHAYLMKYYDVIEEKQLGMFEIDTLIAFQWFFDEKVDYAIIETGLGGRLDSTNLIARPELCMITSIGFDHMALLGTRIEQIAYEKAGIIQPYTRCLIGHLSEKARKVISLQAQRKHARVISLESYGIRNNGVLEYNHTEYSLSTIALYQFHNAALALKAAQLLGVAIQQKNVKEAVEHSQWRGRFETISKDPLIIIDGAHNEQGIRALCESMKQLPSPVTCVFSALKDKQVHEMAGLLKRNCDTLIITEFQNERADTAEDLYVKDAIIEKDYKKAISKAKQINCNGSIVITGSLYFISIVRNLLIHSENFNENLQ